MMMMMRGLHETKLVAKNNKRLELWQVWLFGVLYLIINWKVFTFHIKILLKLMGFKSDISDTSRPYRPYNETLVFVICNSGCDALRKHIESTCEESVNNIKSIISGSSKYAFQLEPMKSTFVN